ncbi:MAG: Do family serine endopeptidase [Rhodanobacteraceae bacterium]
MSRFPWTHSLKRTLPAIARTLTLVLALAAVNAGATLPAAVGSEPLPSLAPMLDHVTPAVVNINSKTRVRVRDPYFDDPFFRRFFGVPDQPRERVQQSLGSGVIVDAAKGYVLTNNHVVASADDIAVTLTDGRTVKAKVVGTDPDSDLAVVQIPADHLTALPLADSSKLRVGDFVVAVGDPFGLGQTVTSGIVSALSRTGLRGQGYQNYIQTDASINPGNSGGALVNLRGELVGINSMIYSPSGGNVGIGFAIPSDLAASVMHQLVAYGEVKRGALGVEAQDITPQLAKLLSIQDDKGAVVTRVRAGSPAAAIGLRAGDTIVSLDGKPVDSAQQLHNLEGLTPTGSAVSLGVLRDGKLLALTTTLKAPVVHTADGAGIDPRLAGAQLADLADSQRLGGNGAVSVTRVADGSRAFRSGLRIGDVIVAVNQHDIQGTRSLARIAGMHPAQLLLTLIRGDKAYFLLLQ